MNALWLDSCLYTIERFQWSTVDISILLVAITFSWCHFWFSRLLQLPSHTFSPSRPGVSQHTSSRLTSMGKLYENIWRKKRAKLGISAFFFGKNLSRRASRLTVKYAQRIPSFFILLQRVKTHTGRFVTNLKAENVHKSTIRDVRVNGESN